MGLQRGVVVNLREQLKDSREHEAALRSERDDLKVDRDKLATQVEVLQSIVTGEVHLQAISDLLGAHHTESQGMWREIRDVFRDIRGDLQERRGTGS